MGPLAGQQQPETKVFLPFDQAHAYALSLTLKTHTSGTVEQEWRTASQHPIRPSESTSTRVARVGHWLGTGNGKGRPTRKQG